MKRFIKLEHLFTTYWLIGISFFFFLLRLPSFFEPYWYGDEGIYEVIGYAMRHGRLLYQGIWDNKPPLLYLIYGMFAGQQTPVRVFSFLVGLAAVWIFFFLAKKLFQKNIIALFTTAVFALLLGSPLLEGNIANAENFMVLPTLFAAFLLFIPLTNEGYRKAISQKEFFLFSTAGFALGLSFLLKVVGLFDMGAFTLFIFFITYKKSIDLFPVIKRLLPLIVGFCVPITLTALFFVLHHAFGIFLQSTLFSNIGYVNYGNQIYVPFTHHIIPQGFLLIKTILLLLFAGILFWKREKISVASLFVWLWLGFTLYSALFSQRAYTHYILIAVPSFSLFLGTIVHNKKAQGVLLVIGVLVFGFAIATFPVYNKTVGYYQNFISYVMDDKDTDTYRAFFDQVTPRDYAVAAYINAHKKPGQTLYIWGNSGQLYLLTHMLPPGRFIVAYHVTMSLKNETETKDVLKKVKPDFIVILPKQDALPYSLQEYTRPLMIQGAMIYERTH